MALGMTFKAEDAGSLASELSDYLQHFKGGGPAPRGEGTLAALLSKSAGRLIHDADREA